MTQKKEKIIWYGHYFFVVSSLLWGITALYGFFTFGWIGRVSDLTPAELVVQMGALLFPIGVFYLLGDYLDRKHLINVETTAIRSYLEELLYPSDMGAQYVQDLNTDLKQQLHTFKSSFSEMARETKDIKEELKACINRVNDIVGHMSKQTQKMSDYVQAFNETMVSAQEQSIGAGQNFVTQADALLNVTNEIQTRLNSSTKQLKAQTEEVAQNVHAVEQAEKNITKALDQSGTWIVSLSENSQKIEKAMKTTDELKNFLLETDKILMRFKEIGTTLDLRLKNLKQHGNPSETKMTSSPCLAKEFTQQMQQILDKLQGLSVEMISIFNPKEEASLWEQYYAGDKSVFMRYIKGVLGQSKSQKIFNAVLADLKLQALVQSYMTEFENLTRGLEDSPWLGVLVGSDPGRLYMVLATIFKGVKNADKIS